MSTFHDTFGAAPAVAAEAPGRVNLIGEHTDYNGGFVLPTAIPQRTVVELIPRDDDTVRAASREADEGRVETFTRGEETSGRGWVDYVQGTTWVLRQAGHVAGGFDALIRSDVPVGSGLSSSAALLVALLKAQREAFALEIDDVEVARLAQRAENDFVGARVGIMDQMACSLADARTALFLDTRDLSFRRVPLPDDALDLVVINSGIAHRLSEGDGGYNQRRAECEEAARLLGVPQLRDVSAHDLPQVGALPAPLDRRARHVVTENQRVLDAVAALEARDVERLGALFDASHASMRDDYAVSIPEIDLLVRLARADRAVYGARLTGGGFGGSIVALCRVGEAGRVAAEVAAAYTSESGHRAAVMVPDTASAPRPNA